MSEDFDNYFVFEGSREAVGTASDSLKKHLADLKAKYPNDMIGVSPGPVETLSDGRLRQGLYVSGEGMLLTSVVWSGEYFWAPPKSVEDVCLFADVICEDGCDRMVLGEGDWERVAGYPFEVWHSAFAAWCATPTTSAEANPIFDKCLSLLDERDFEAAVSWLVKGGVETDDGWVDGQNTVVCVLEAISRLAGIGGLIAAKEHDDVLDRLPKIAAGARHARLINSETAGIVSGLAEELILGSGTGYGTTRPIRRGP